MEFILCTYIGWLILLLIKLADTIITKAYEKYCVNQLHKQLKEDIKLENQKEELAIKIAYALEKNELTDELINQWKQLEKKEKNPWE